VRDYYIFDIETGPLSTEELKRVMPVFQPAKNLVDQVKIDNDIAKKMTKWMEGAALSAITGKILCIGYYYKGDYKVIGEKDESEKEILERFWHLFIDDIRPMWIGHCIESFDLPFIVQRSWKHKVFIPPIRNGRWLINRFEDTCSMFCNFAYGKSVSLNDMAKFFELPVKTDNAKDFHRLWKTDRPKALQYVLTDVEITFQSARRMGMLID